MIAGQRDRRIRLLAALLPALILWLAAGCALPGNSRSAPEAEPDWTIGKLDLGFRMDDTGAGELDYEATLSIAAGRQDIVMRLPWGEENAFSISRLWLRYPQQALEERVPAADDTGRRPLVLNEAQPFNSLQLPATPQTFHDWQELKLIPSTHGLTSAESDIGLGYQLSVAGNNSLLALALPFAGEAMVELRFEAGLEAVCTGYADALLLELPVLQGEQSRGLAALDLTVDPSRLGVHDLSSVQGYLKTGWNSAGEHSPTIADKSVNWHLEAYDSRLPLILRLTLPLPAGFVTQSSDTIRPLMETDIRNQKAVQQLGGRLARRLTTQLPYVIALLTLVVVLMLLVGQLDQWVTAWRHRGTLPDRPEGVSRSLFAWLIRDRVTGDALYAALLDLTAAGLLGYNNGEYRFMQPEEPEEPEEPGRPGEPEGACAGGREIGDRATLELYRVARKVFGELPGFTTEQLQQLATAYETRQELAAVLAAYGAAVTAELEAQGLLRRQRRSQLFYLLSAAVLLVVLIALTVLSGQGLPLLLLPLVLLLVVAASRVRHLSAEGYRRLGACLAYLRGLERGREGNEAAGSQALYDRFLDALSVGVEDAWLRRHGERSAAEGGLTAAFYRQVGSPELARRLLTAPASSAERKAVTELLAKRCFKGRMDMMAVHIRSRIVNLR
ncbi:MAG: DUF2207 domain-containing protein [Bacillota bacterium]|nr:DUF2207 domain-containing protein [Bacillota bacterium]